MKKDASIILHQNGTLSNFEIPSCPGQPHAINISRQSITLCWSEPDCGSQSIQQYKIYSQKTADTQWMLSLTTTDATNSADVTNLDKENYRFKIQGITLAGDTVESPVSDIIG